MPSTQVRSPNLCSRRPQLAGPTETARSSCRLDVECGQSVCDRASCFRAAAKGWPVYASRKAAKANVVAIAAAPDALAKVGR